jgi:hypothetical protein
LRNVRIIGGSGLAKENRAILLEDITAVVHSYFSPLDR